MEKLDKDTIEKFHKDIIDELKRLRQLRQRIFDALLSATISLFAFIILSDQNATDQLKRLAEKTNSAGKPDSEHDFTVLYWFVLPRTETLIDAHRLKSLLFRLSYELHLHPSRLLPVFTCAMSLHNIERDIMLMRLSVMRAFILIDAITYAARRYTPLQGDELLHLDPSRRTTISQRDTSLQIELQDIPLQRDTLSQPESPQDIPLPLPPQIKLQRNTQSQDRSEPSDPPKQLEANK